MVVVSITSVVDNLSVELASVVVVYGVVFVCVVVPSVVVLYVVLGGPTVVLIPPAFGVLETSATVVVTIPIVLVVSTAPVVACVVCCSEVLAAVVCGWLVNSPALPSVVVLSVVVISSLVTVEVPGDVVGLLEGVLLLSVIVTVDTSLAVEVVGYSLVVPAVVSLLGVKGESVVVW